MHPTQATHRSRAAVGSARRRIEHEFGEFETIEQDWPVDLAVYRAYIDRIRRGTLGGAGAWVVDDAGRVLLVREVGRDGWHEPGGHHEPGETLVETALREVREETGLNVELDGVGLFQRLNVSPRSANKPTLYRVAVVFTASPIGGTLRPQPGEIADIDWFEDHPESLLYDELRRLEVPAAADGTEV